MLKDPNDTTLTPYELLALAPDASAAEVQKALPRFMQDRRNLSRLGQAQEGVRKLQSSKARASIDIWFYHLDLSQIDSSSDRDAGMDLGDFQKIPVFPPEELYCDLDGGVMQSEFREINVSAVKFSEVSAFDGHDDLELQPLFDR